MTAMTDQPAWLRHAPALLLAAAIFAPGFALVSQFGFGLHPCELCIWQRWPYVPAIGFSLAALLLRGRARAVCLALAALSFAATAAIGVFHVGVEQKWWAGLAACSGGDTPGTVDALRDQLLGKPVVRCDEIAFQVFGISMAGWNAIFATAAAAFGLAAAFRLSADD